MTRDKLLDIARDWKGGFINYHSLLFWARVCAARASPALPLSHGLCQRSHLQPVSLASSGGFFLIRACWRSSILLCHSWSHVPLSLLHSEALSHVESSLTLKRLQHQTTTLRAWKKSQNRIHRYLHLFQLLHIANTNVCIATMPFLENASYCIAGYDAPRLPFQSQTLNSCQKVRQCWRVVPTAFRSIFHTAIHYLSNWFDAVPFAEFQLVKVLNEFKKSYRDMTTSKYLFSSLWLPRSPWGHHIAFCLPLLGLRIGRHILS